MTFISVFRTAAMTLSLFFGLVVLGLTAHWTWGTLQGDALIDFEIVAFVAGGTTTLVLPVMLVVGMIRRNAVTSMIAVELPTLTVIWILFLVVGVLTAQWNNIFYPIGCGDLFPADAGWCREFFAIEGLSFVTWIALFLYTVTLLIYALVAQSRGNMVWKTAVSDAVFFTAPHQTANTLAYANYGAPVPAQMPQYPPGSVPMVQSSPMGVNQQYFGGVPAHSGYPQV